MRIFVCISNINSGNWNNLLHTSLRLYKKFLRGKEFSSFIQEIRWIKHKSHIIIFVSSTGILFFSYFLIYNLSNTVTVSDSYINIQRRYERARCICLFIISRCFNVETLINYFYPLRYAIASIKLVIIVKRLREYGRVRVNSHQFHSYHITLIILMPGDKFTIIAWVSMSTSQSV